MRYGQRAGSAEGQWRAREVRHRTSLATRVAWCRMTVCFRMRHSDRPHRRPPGRVAFGRRHLVPPCSVISITNIKNLHLELLSSLIVAIYCWKAVAASGADGTQPQATGATVRPATGSRLRHRHRHRSMRSVFNINI